MLNKYWVNYLTDNKPQDGTLSSWKKTSFTAYMDLEFSCELRAEVLFDSFGKAGDKDKLVALERVKYSLYFIVCGTTQNHSQMA